jgi:hypothetical protein
MLADDVELSNLTNRLFSDPNFDFEAEIGAILARGADNAQVVMDIQEQRMHSLFMRFLTD